MWHNRVPAIHSRRRREVYSGGEPGIAERKRRTETRRQNPAHAADPSQEDLQAGRDVKQVTDV